MATLALAVVDFTTIKHVCNLFPKPTALLDAIVTRGLGESVATLVLTIVDFGPMYLVG